MDNNYVIHFGKENVNWNEDDVYNECFLRMIECRLREEFEYLPDPLMTVAKIRKYLGLTPTKASYFFGWEKGFDEIIGFNFLKNEDGSYDIVLRGGHKLYLVEDC